MAVCYHLDHFVIFLSQFVVSFACHCAGNWMSKLSSQSLKESTVLLFSSQASHIAVYCLSSSTRGNRYDLAWVACKAETPILDNCSEMCLCRGAWGNKLTTNIITVLVEHWRKFYMEREGDREAHRGRETMKGSKGKSLCKKRSFFESVLTLDFIYTKYRSSHQRTLNNVALCTFQPCCNSKKLFSEVVFCFCCIYEPGQCCLQFGSEAGLLNWYDTAVPSLLCTFPLGT